MRLLRNVVLLILITGLVRPALAQTTRPSDLSMSGPASAPATKPVAKYVKADAIDYKVFLGDPPADDSPQHKAEIDTILSLQADRTPEQEKRCQAEEEVTVFAFADVLGPWFDAKDLTVTDQVMRDAYGDARLASNTAKDIWKRVRPPLADKRIKPCVKLEKTASYPSGHGTRGMVWATLLAEVFPAKRDVLMACGREIGTNRVLGGMHWPSDVEAGQKLGAEFAKKLLENEAFRAEFDKAKAEMLAHAR